MIRWSSMEIVFLDAKGRPCFEDLQNHDTKNSAALIFYAFDLLDLDGKDTSKLPLIERKATLQDIIGDGAGCLRFSGFINSATDKLINAVKAQNLEGIVAKQLNSRYEPNNQRGRW